MSDTESSAPDPANWTCTIGEFPRGELPDGADWPMRQAVEQAYRDLTGRESDYTFSGWGDPLPEDYRAVHEGRLPDPSVSLGELREQREMLIDEVRRSGQGTLTSIEILDWLRRNVGQEGAPEDWEISNYVSLVVVKLAQATLELESEYDAPEPDTHTGCTHLLSAAAVLIDAAEHFARRADANA